MGRIKIQSIVESLDYDMRRALEAAVEEVPPDTNVDRGELYRAFRRAVGRTCNTWVTDPDHHVQV